LKIVFWESAHHTKPVISPTLEGLRTEFSSLAKVGAQLLECFSDNNCICYKAWPTMHSLGIPDYLRGAKVARIYPSDLQRIGHLER